MKTLRLNYVRTQSVKWDVALFVEGSRPTSCSG
jgi:hypothetical protein